MIYFDTDVLINYLVEQDKVKNTQAIDLYQYATEEGLFFCSLLCLQETAFVLSKLGVKNGIIEEITSRLLLFKPVSYSRKEYERACLLAKRVGFQSINDCLHTAIAESYCTEIYTYNKSDFKKIKMFTDLKVTIL